MRDFLLLVILFFVVSSSCFSQNKKRARDFGIQIGIFEPGKNNSITDVVGVSVGHKTVMLAIVFVQEPPQSSIRKPLPESSCCDLYWQWFWKVNRD